MPAMTSPAVVAALRQILAVLECERQALAGLDIEAITGCAAKKAELCAGLEARVQHGMTGAAAMPDELRSQLEAARRRNAVNRQIRNLLAANVAARLDSLAGAPALYAASPAAVALKAQR